MKKKTTRKKNPVIVRFPFMLKRRDLLPIYFTTPQALPDRIGIAQYPLDTKFIGYSPDLKQMFVLRKPEGKGWELQSQDADPGWTTMLTWKRKPPFIKKSFTARAADAPYIRARRSMRRGKVPKPRKKRARKRNPQLMIVTNPRTRANIPRKALAAYEAFHGTNPMRVTKVKVPPGTPRHLIELGKVKTVQYRPTNRSQLADKRASETIMTHKFGRDAMLVTDPEGTFLGVVNPRGTTRVKGLKKGHRKIGIVG